MRGRYPIEFAAIEVAIIKLQQQTGHLYLPVHSLRHSVPLRVMLYIPSFETIWAW
jgi:hypothetical protein